MLERIGASIIILSIASIPGMMAYITWATRDLFEMHMFIIMTIVALASGIITFTDHVRIGNKWILN